MKSIGSEIYRDNNTKDLIKEIKDLLTVDKEFLVEKRYCSRAKTIINYFGVYYCLDFFNEVYGWNI